MEFFINGFLAALGAVAVIGTLWFTLWFLWNFGPVILVAILSKVLPKKMQAEFIRDLKKDKWRNAEVLRITRKLGWHEEE